MNSLLSARRYTFNPVAQTTRTRWLPERLQDWQERRSLERQIEEINRRFQPRMAAAKTDQEEHHIDQEWVEAIEQYQVSMGVLKTKRLIKLANRWEVEIPSGAWTNDRYENVRYIAPPHQIKLRRSIRDARREAVKWWVQLLTPIISVLTGLAGALIGLFTYLRKG